MFKNVKCVIFWCQINLEAEVFQIRGSPIGTKIEKVGSNKRIEPMLLCLVVKNMFIIKIKLEINKIITKANYNYSPKAKLTNQYTRVYLKETYFNNRLSKLKNIERTGGLSAFISSKAVQDHLGLVYHLWEEGRREKGRWEEGRLEEGSSMLHGGA